MIGRFSRYNLSAVMRVLDASGSLVLREHLDVRNILTKTSYRDNKYYVPVKGDLWPTLAWRFLGNPALWWVLADFSGVIDPLTALEATPRYRSFAQLSADVPAGFVSSLMLTRTRDLRAGMLLRIENLDPGTPTSFQAFVQAVNLDTGLVHIATTSVPAPGVPAALSRVSEVLSDKAQLTIPAQSAVYLDVLNFDNPMTTFPE